MRMKREKEKKKKKKRREGRRRDEKFHLYQGVTLPGTNMLSFVPGISTSTN
jgi:hypothetical protein